MDTYIGIKNIKARPMQLGAARKYLGRDITPKSPVNKNGYVIQYEDGYESWSPKDTFERAYRKMGNKDNTITSADVDAFIARTETAKLGEKTTIVVATLVNGFVITETSSCVDPKNFNLEVGRDICLKEIKNKIWGYLGFMLQSAVNGMNNK